MPRCGVCGHRYGDYIIPHAEQDCGEDREKAPSRPHYEIDDLINAIDEAEMEEDDG